MGVAALALALEFAGFNRLFGVVPRAAGVGHQQRHDHACQQRAQQHAAQRDGSEEKADNHRRQHGQHPRGNHFAQGRVGRDRHAAGGVGLGGALQQARNFAELTADFRHHLHRRPAHRTHGHGRGQHDHHAAQQHPDHHARFGDVHDDGLADRQFNRFLIGDEQRQRGQRRRTDGEALAGGRGGVADGVEVVGDLADFRGLMRHLGDAAGVVRNRARGINRHGHAGGGQHPHRRNGDAVLASGLVGHEDRRDDHQDRHRTAFHPHRQAGDDIGRRPGLGGGDDLGHRLGRGVVPGRPTDGDAGQVAGDDGGEQRPAIAEDHHRQQGQQQEHAGGAEFGNRQRPFRPLLSKRGHAVNTHQRGHQADARQRQRQGQQHRAAHAIAEVMSQLSSGGSRRQGDGRHHRSHIGFVDIRAHASDVADVVAHVVGDDARVARIVFGDAGLDLANQIGADVSGLGEDAAADPGEQRNGRSAHREAPDGGRRIGINGELGGQEEEQNTQAQQPEAGHGQAHHRAAVKGHQQRRARALFARRRGSANVGLGGRLHPDQTGQRRGQRAHQKRHAGAKAMLHGQQHRHHQGEDTDLGVLRPQIGHRAQVNLISDGPHEGVAGGLLDDPAIQHRGGSQTQQARHQRYHCHSH